MKKLLGTTASLCLIASMTPTQSNAQATIQLQRTQFTLAANPAFVRCLTDSTTAPQATVTATRGQLNDTLTISVSGLKPGLAFDLFTVQRSSLDANGNPAPNFPGSFGLAWYQTDLQADGDGHAQAMIRTILLGQIFGFDADTRSDGTTTTTILPPTNTFHVGFWFNNPADAAPCGFDPSKPTPFNGEHRAGPLAMISLPDPATGLGPLCISPTGADPNAPNVLACNP
jgi:hypothetical protein